MNNFCKGFESQPWAPLALSGPTRAGERGFSWGYVDLLDDAHNGVVVIWCFGLPFLPGTVGAGRSGRPVVPHAEPSLSIAVYEQGRQTFYMLQRFTQGHDTSEVFPDGGLQMDDCRFHARPGGLSIQLDCPVPGTGRLTGSLEVTGTDVDLGPAGPSTHRWAPRLLGSGRADLSCGSWSFSMSGVAYHDTNASTVGLEELGIRRWIWGRTPHPGGTFIHYLCEPSDPSHAPQNLWLAIDHDGAVDTSFQPVTMGPDATGRWGMRCPTELTVGPVRIRHGRNIEDGPFYQRWQTQVTMPDGTLHTGTGETVDVTRMDTGWMAPLTRMAVYDPASPGWWVPLFAGHPADRWRRLLRHWTGR